MNLNYIFLCLSDKFYEIDKLHKKIYYINSIILWLFI
jgi:hypothetical protein